jgi:Ca2+-binding RTX toxin-like protein
VAVINGTSGDDLDANKLLGTSQADQIFGLGGLDELVALGKNDLLEGGPGADYLDGGDGIDTASYASSSDPKGVWVILNNGSAERYGDAEGDTLISIENVIGSAFGDSLTGDEGNNVIRAGKDEDYLSGGGGNDELDGGDAGDLMAANEGNDKLLAGPGNDLMSGGLGRDQFTGGKGGDVYDFGSIDESGLTNATRDLITDFKPSQDDLLFFRGGPFSEDYVMIGKAEFSGTHQARFEFSGSKTIVELNTDADLDADMSIALSGKINLTAGDFSFHD